MSTQILKSNGLLDALELLDLTYKDGVYTSSSELISSQETSELANIFFNAMGNVGTSRFSIRVIHEGKDLHPAQFLDSRTGDGLIDHVTVRDRVLHHYLQQGATIVFDHINDQVPVAQVIQDRVEALTGSKCWVQCYVTQASTSAFAMHRDDHAFVIIQLFGRKEWRHAAETSNAPESVVYTPGSVSFYPVGTPHDVHGLGEMSMHLTVAFEGFDGMMFHELDPTAAGKHIRRRRGSALPYSIRTELITSETPARLAVSYLPPSLAEASPLEVFSGVGKLAVPKEFAGILKELAESPSTTPAQASSSHGIDLHKVMQFWTFGFENGLLLNPA